MRERTVDREAMERLLAQEGHTAEGVILRLAYLQGLTRDEIRQLTWNDVSFSTGQLVLPDRTVPLEEDAQVCLETRYALRGSASPFVASSDRDRRQLQPESISRLARNALDRGGLAGVCLADLRWDFILRQMEARGWPYAARVSGVAAATLYARFAGSLPRSASSGGQSVDEFRLWKVLQAEGRSPAGLTLWLTWKLGVPVKDVVTLTWDRVDLEAGELRLEDRTVPLGDTLCRLLRETRAEREDGEDPHVILTPRSRRPMDQPRLSKLVRTALIRGGVEDVTLQDLNREERREREDGVLLRYVQEKGSITRREAMGILGLQKVAAYSHLRRLAEAGKLVRVGGRYYPAGRVVPPEEQYEAVRARLEQTGSAYRQELAELLHVEARQCTLILRHLVEDGKLVQTGQRYSLPPEGEAKLV